VSYILVALINGSSL